MCVGVFNVTLKSAHISESKVMTSAQLKSRVVITCVWLRMLWSFNGTSTKLIKTWSDFLCEICVCVCVCDCHSKLVHPSLYFVFLFGSVIVSIELAQLRSKWPGSKLVTIQLKWWWCLQDRFIRPQSEDV